jgi:hypothetical protein
LKAHSLGNRQRSGYCGAAGVLVAESRRAILFPGDAPECGAKSGNRVLPYWRSQWHPAWSKNWKRMVQKLERRSKNWNGAQKLERRDEIWKLFYFLVPDIAHLLCSITKFPLIIEYRGTENGGWRIEDGGWRRRGSGVRRECVLRNLWVKLGEYRCFFSCVASRTDPP